MAINEVLGRTSGTLIDIAPTILELQGVDKPQTMTGKSLLQESGEWLLQ